MAALQDLIEQITDPILRERISREVNKLTENKSFGLVFEEHIPEVTALYDIPIKQGCLAMSKDKSDKTIYTVTSVNNGEAVCATKNTPDERTIFSVDDIVCVAEFGQPIYPYLEQVGSVCNAPDSNLWHTLIEADNYHALQLLKYMYAGKVDCIYIDPPYNTGARDWKYNNDYVDSNDQYRHSKWLSMMEKRLKLAKLLLNQQGVLIVAIDDNEMNDLGLLLKKIFPYYDLFCITVVQNPNGNQGQNFGRTNEFAYFVIPSGQQVLSFEDRSDTPDIRPLRDVSGNSNMRTDAKNCFYPIFVKDEAIVGFGDVCDEAFHPNAANVVRNDGIIEIYPIDASGKERKWVFARQSVDTILNELHVEWNDSRKIYDIIRYKTKFTYKTVWDKKSFSANSYGSKLINKILSDKRFDYPKSLFTVYECIKAVCGEKQNALIVDFFAGSGTTLHAVNLLNAEDGGHRRCIMVTNNEVSESEEKDLTEQGFHQGDPEWEKYGIARYVTWPRTVCSIEGHDVNGNPLEGNYGIETEMYEPDNEVQTISAKTGRPVRRTVYKKTKRQLYPKLAGINMSDGFKANAVYFKLGFLDKDSVALGHQFRELLPIFWMKAGCIGPCPTVDVDSLPESLILPENGFAVILARKVFAEFEEQVNIERDKIKTVYIVTNSESEYRSMAASFKGMETYQIYRDYLDNFRLNVGV